MNSLLVIFVILVLIVLGGAVAMLVLASQKTNCHGHEHRHPPKDVSPTPLLKGGEPLTIYPTGPVGAFIDTADGYSTFNLFTLTIDQDPTTNVITSFFQRTDKDGNRVGNTIPLYVNQSNSTSSAPPFSVKSGWYDPSSSTMLIYGNIEFEEATATAFSPSVFDPSTHNTLAKNRNDMSGVAWGTTALGYNSADPTKYCWYLGSFSPTANNGAVESKGTLPIGAIDVKPYPDVYATGISLDSSKNPLFPSMVALINPVVVGNPGSPDPFTIQDATTISILGLVLGSPLTSLANVVVSTSLPPSQIVVDGLDIYVVMVDKVNDGSQIARYTTNYVVESNGFPFNGNDVPQVKIGLDKTFGTNGVLITPAVVTDLKIVTSHWGSKKTNSKQNLCPACTNWKCFNVGMTALVTSQVSSSGGKVFISIYKTADGALYDSYPMTIPASLAPRELINVGITDRVNLTESRLTMFGDINHPTQFGAFPLQGTNMVNLISVALRTLQPKFVLQTLHHQLPYVAYGSDQTSVSGVFPLDATGTDCYGRVFCRSTTGGAGGDPCCSKVPVFYGNLPPNAKSSDYGSNGKCHWPMDENNPKNCPAGVDPNLCYDTLSICTSINADQKKPDWTSECPMVLPWTTDVTTYRGIRSILSFSPCYEARDILGGQMVTSYSQSIYHYKEAVLSLKYSVFDNADKSLPSQFISEGCRFVGPGTAWTTSPPSTRDKYAISFDLAAFNNCEAVSPYNATGPAYLEYGLFTINNSIPVSNFLDGMAFGYVDGTTTRHCHFNQFYGPAPKLAGLDDIMSFCSN
jgi:hypothetical protein